MTLPLVARMYMQSCCAKNKFILTFIHAFMSPHLCNELPSSLLCFSWVYWPSWWNLDVLDSKHIHLRAAHGFYRHCHLYAFSAFVTLQYFFVFIAKLSFYNKIISVFWSCECCHHLRATFAEIISWSSNDFDDLYVIFSLPWFCQLSYFLMAAHCVLSESFLSPFMNDEI